MDVVASDTTPELLLTTAQAAELIGRSPGAVRWAIKSGELPSAARTPTGQHRVRPTDVLLWAKRHPARLTQLRNTWEQTAVALATLGQASADELGAYLGLHPGNARKHLLILAAQGRAQRLPDGQWVPVTESHVGAA
jgi:hypothetical protein